jgi:hypothetical protein
MNSNGTKAGNGKATTAVGADMKAPDTKTSAAPATAEPAGQDVSQPGSPQPEMVAPGVHEHHPLIAAMRTRWGKFTDAELKTLKTREDLTSAVESKYGIAADQAATQVKEWAVGRQF